MKKLLSVVLCSLTIISTTHSYALTFKSGEKKSFETEDASSSAQDLQLPETQFPISEDEHLVVVERGITTLPQFKGQRIAWKDSVLTVRGFPGYNGSVFRFQTREGLRNEEQDSADSQAARHSRAEVGTINVIDNFALGDVNTISYEFYVSNDQPIVGHSRLHFGQVHGSHSDSASWNVSVAPAQETGLWDYPLFLTSDFAKREIKPLDLILTYTGILDTDGKEEFSKHIWLADGASWKGRWNKVEVSTRYGNKDEGAFRFKFNGRSVIDCNPCDTSLSHPSFRSVFKDIAEQPIGFFFNFGIHRYIYNIEHNYDFQIIDPVIYYRNVSLVDGGQFADFGTVQPPQRVYPWQVKKVKSVPKAPEKPKLRLEQIPMDVAQLDVVINRLNEGDDYIQFLGSIEDKTKSQLWNEPTWFSLIFDFRRPSHKSKLRVRDYKISLSTDNFLTDEASAAIKKCDQVSYWLDDDKVGAITIYMKNFAENECLLNALASDVRQKVLMVASNLKPIIDKAVYEDTSYSERMEPLKAKMK